MFFPWQGKADSFALDSRSMGTGLHPEVCRCSGCCMCPKLSQPVNPETGLGFRGGGRGVYVGMCRLQDTPTNVMFCVVVVGVVAACCGACIDCKCCVPSRTYTHMGALLNRASAVFVYVSSALHNMCELTCIS
jgi:hypothetical protein